MTSPLSAKELIKGAQRQQRSTRINLRGDLRAQIEVLEMELEDERGKESEGPRSNARLTDVSPTLAIANRIKALEEEMANNWLDLTLEAKSTKEWRAFKAANPPRENVDEDGIVSMNFDNLTFDFMPKCVVEPELDAEDWEGLFDKVAPADLRELGGMAYALHERVSDIPKSRLASVIRARSADDSEPQNDSESASDASTDGSQSSSPSTLMSQDDHVPHPKPGPPSPPPNPNTTS